MEFLNPSRCVISSTLQSDVENWKKERYGFFTATRWNSLINFCRTEEQKQDLAKEICGIIIKKIPDESLPLVQYGIDNEHHLREILETLTGEKVYEVGLIKSKIYPMFACSVDGILGNDIAEFKTTKKTTPTHSYPDYREINIGYLWQMQHNMFITGAKRCHFLSYSYTDCKLYYRIVDYNPEIWEFLRPQGIDFYNKYILPLLTEI